MHRICAGLALSLNCVLFFGEGGGRGGGAGAAVVIVHVGAVCLSYPSFCLSCFDDEVCFEPVAAVVVHSCLIFSVY